MNDRIHDRWPDIPYGPWCGTCSALHLYSQIIGKYRLARTPWVNHSWHATLYPNARGFTTGLVPDGAGGIELSLDLVDHQVVGAATDGRTARFPLEPMSVASFHAHALDLVRSLGGTAELNGMPNEIPNAIPFAEDRAERPYDADAVARFFKASIAVTAVLQTFRTAYLGKVSPVHLFWGALDLAVTRFSGRVAPPHPGGAPNCGPHCPTRSPAKPTVMRFRRLAFGRAVERSTFPPSIPMPIRHRLASPRQRSFPTPHTTRRALENSCCLMTRCAEQPIRKRCSWVFSRAPIAPLPTSRNGMPPLSNAQSDNLADHGACKCLLAQRS
jgi:hypothetical protein